MKKSDITKNKEKTGTLILPVFKTVYKHSDNNNSTSKLYINESFFILDKKMNPRIFNIMEEKEEEELKLLEDKIKRLKEKYEQQKKILYWNMKISKKNFWI